LDLGVYDLHLCEHFHCFSCSSYILHVHTHSFGTTLKNKDAEGQSEFRKPTNYPKFYIPMLRTRLVT